MLARRIRFAALGPVLALGLAVPAHADVEVTSAPTISGSPVVGAKLTAVGGATKGPWDRTVGRVWLQCPSATAGEWSCQWIEGSNATTYVVRPGDKDRWVRVALYAYKGSDWDYKVSNPTARITAAPTPTPTPTPTPVPVETPAPEPVVVEAEATPVPVAEPLPVATLAAPTLKPTTPAEPRMLRPYPTVRISGRLTPGGARITRLTVQAPNGARITLRCDGRGCPVRKVAHATKVVHMKAFERELRAGTKLTITISKPGHISKVTRITIRKGKTPARSDRCQLPGRSRLIRCPSS